MLDIHFDAPTCFQNSEVISYLTIPNVQDLNKTDTCQCRFFSGDWAGFQQYAESNPDIRYLHLPTSTYILCMLSYYRKKKFYINLCAFNLSKGSFLQLRVTLCVPSCLTVHIHVTAEFTHLTVT